MTEIERRRAAVLEVPGYRERAISLADEALAPPEPVPDTRPVLTDRQRNILDYIAVTRQTHGYSPTVREMMQATGIKSPNGVVCHLKALEKKGYIDRNVYMSRAIVPVEAS